MTSGSKGSSLDERRQTPIETTRLRIVPFGEAHLTEQYVGWLNDPEVVRYSDQRYAVHTLESCRRYWESFRGTPHYFWAVVARDPSLGHIGNMNAYLNPIHKVADVGILLGEPSIWGQGYGLEAWNAVCRYLVDEVGVRKVTAGTVAANHAMLALMKRSGMVEDGRRQRHCLYDGAEIDVIHAALFRSK